MLEEVGNTASTILEIIRKRDLPAQYGLILQISIPYRYLYDKAHTAQVNLASLVFRARARISKRNFFKNVNNHFV